MRLEAIRGDDPIRATRDLYRTMHQLYTTTVEKMWGSEYLSAEFFDLLAQAPEDFRKHLLFIVAYDENDEIVAGTINMVSATHFYGRYWGAFRFVTHLHFEACYYKAIEYCIDHDIKYMEPGAGGGEYKFLRGFNPFIVRSVHWFRDPSLKQAVASFLEQEREQNQYVTSYLTENSYLSGKT